MHVYIIVLVTFMCGYDMNAMDFQSVHELDNEITRDKSQFTTTLFFHGKFTCGGNIFKEASAHADPQEANRHSYIDFQHDEVVGDVQKVTMLRWQDPFRPAFAVRWQAQKTNNGTHDAVRFMNRTGAGDMYSDREFLRVEVKPHCFYWNVYHRRIFREEETQTEKKVTQNITQRVVTFKREVACENKETSINMTRTLGTLAAMGAIVGVYTYWWKS